jgi:hypothetical protein
MNKWLRLRELSWRDLHILLQAAALLAYARFRLPFLHFRADPAFDVTATTSTKSESVMARAQSIARLVTIAAAHCPVKVACLHRSLVLWWLLRRRRIPCAIRLGASTWEGRFTSHAWVQCGTEAINEPDAHLSRYHPFDAAFVPVRREQLRVLARASRDCKNALPRTLLRRFRAPGS